MIIECINNITSSKQIKNRYGKAVIKNLVNDYHLYDDKLSLELGKKYIVYGIIQYELFPMYYICDEDYDGVKINYPIFYPSIFFKIINFDFSKYWKIGEINYEIKNKIEKIISIISFPEWSMDDTYYERLIDGDSEADRIFNEKKILIDREFGFDI